MEPFTTDKINEVTNKMNRLNLRNIPLKQNVTVEMIQEYVNKLIKWCSSQKRTLSLFAFFKII
ncbi:YpbS family protein [Bacillus sp. CMF21]|nr:YpbS family protein [Bacillus sp. CMF21]